MDDDLKHNISEHGTWVRAFYMVIFFIVYSIAEVVLAAVIIFQFLSRLLTAKLNAKLLSFGADLSKFAYEVLMYLTYNSEIKPFPFGDWPTNTDTEASKTPTKKRSPKKSKVTRLKKDNPDDDGQNSGV